MIEFMVRYAFKLTTHLQRTSIKSFSPLPKAVDDYYVWSHQLMKRLTVSEPCHSWFKAGGDAHGPATAVYAGSRAHFFEALLEPRMEDFEIEYLKEDGREENRFAYLGNGFAEVEGRKNMDATWYLKLLQEENEKGRDLYDINPMRKRGERADLTIVMPREKRESKL